MASVDKDQELSPELQQFKVQAQAVLKRLEENPITAADLRDALTTLLVYTRNLIQYPDEKKYGKVKLSNPHYLERLGKHVGALEAMALIGYKVHGEYLRLDDAHAPAISMERLKLMEQLASEHLERVNRVWEALPPRLDDSHVYSSVTGVGCHSEQGKRISMEDDEIIIDSYCGDSKQGFFGLYDGHGGRATVDFVVKVLHTNIQNELKNHSHWQEAFRRAYLITDDQLRRNNILRSGSTSVTCVVSLHEGKRMLYTANVGDSRAVLCRAGTAVRLSLDHKGSIPEEAKRITDAGGFIAKNLRVNGVLAITRALGDHMLKDYVSAEPYYRDIELTHEDTYLILACDGLWDVMSDQEAVEFVQKKVRALSGDTLGEETARQSGQSYQSKESSLRGRQLNNILKLVSKALVQEALDRRSQDNVTAMVIKL